MVSPTSPARRTARLFLTATLAVAGTAGAVRAQSSAPVAAAPLHAPATGPILQVPTDRRRTLTGPVIGIVVGAALGGALGAGIAQGACERPRCGEWRRGMAVGAVVGALVGVSIGAIVGHVTPRDWP